MVQAKASTTGTYIDSSQPDCVNDGTGPPPSEMASAKENPAQRHAAPKCKRRYIVLLFCFLANVVCFVDRTNIAVAALAIQDDYGWSDADMGVALSSFFYGYAIMQIPSGWLSARFGGKKVLAVCVALWSMFTIITPFAVHVSFGTLLAARVGMGLAEAASMPCVHAIIGTWFPPGETSFAISFSTSGQAIGTIIALISSPMVSWYWPSVFYVFGVIGLVWTVLFAIFCPENPTAQDRQEYSVELVDTVSGEAKVEDVDTTCFDNDGDEDDDAARGGTDSLQDCEAPAEQAAAAQQANTTASLTAPKMSCDQQGLRTARISCTRTMRYLCQPSFIAIVVAHMTHNYGYYVTLMWLPAYFSSLGSLAFVKRCVHAT